MFKHIFGQAVYQFIILLILIFNADNFMPEYADQFDDQIAKDFLPRSVKYNGDYVRSGRYIYVDDPEKSDYQDLETVIIFMIIFNILLIIFLFIIMFYY